MTFPIVAIGASAGGLEAMAELLGALPAKSGMAFILVQHLNPDHESLLPEILSKKTSIPVKQVQGDEEVAPDQVYLIAPNTTITLVDNLIHVVPRASGVHHPADILFTSVAHERAELAIGVVLSGGDADGAAGLEAIKQAGGITFAQEPATARFPSMPQKAIDTGCVDFVKRPSEIARELVRLVRHSYLRPTTQAFERGEEAEATTDSVESALRRIFRRLRSAQGVDFSHYKRSTLRRRLERRMLLKKTDEIGEYALLLESDAVETAALYQDFLIRVTGFFRDSESFVTLTQRVFPNVCESRPAKAPVRIWVPGCASGEEVFSIAIALREYLNESASPAAIQIFGTDVSDAALEKARAGVYSENITQEVSGERLARFFLKQNGNYQIAKSIRDLCVFARHDITRDPPFSRLDLVSCRNLLIYLDTTAQRRVMGSFHYALWPKGFLLLGPSETVGAAASLFQVTDEHHRLYTPSAIAPGSEVHRHSMAASYLHASDTVTAAEPIVLESDLAQREADRLLLARFAPASVLIDDALNILQFRGETAPYLEHASGPSSLNLQRVVRPELLVEIAPAIQKARETGLEVRCATLQLDERPEVNVAVIPLRRASPQRCYLILFEGVSRGDVARRAQQLSSSLPESEKDRRLVQLEHEITSLRDYLQATMEEHEASQEELKSAHEEVLSASEEFQSTNEELETAKEELQSANEELTTTSEELRQRNRDLGVLNVAVEGAKQAAEQAQAAGDIIVESVREPLLVLDDKLHIVRVNRAFCTDFDVRARDIEGKLLYHIGDGNWNLPALREGLLNVVARNETLEDFEIAQVLPRIGRRIISLNARKMPGDGHRPALILLAIADVTARNEREAQLAQEATRKDEFLAMLAHELRNPLAPIATAVKILRGGDGNPDAPGLHDMIDRQTRRLSRLVDELLDLGRFSRGLIELKREPLDLGLIVEQTIAAMRPQLEVRQHELSVTIPEERIFVNGDPVRLEQVLSNLLDNASKYTHPGGRIAVTLREISGEAVLSVRDNGIGLAPDTMEQIFGLFTQINRSAVHAGEGLGIGLTLVRRVLELHGGRIEARSLGLGQGSEFIVHLPSMLAPTEHPPGAAVNVQKSAFNTAAAPRRVLIVDDNEDVRQSLMLLARSWGYAVAGAADGSSAIALAEKFEPHAALVDIGMPGMNGYELARHFRAAPRYSQLQLVAMTGFGREEDRQAALAAGFDSHLVKPIGFDELEALLANKP